MIKQRFITIAASSALSAALGSIHAFSVFIPEWETRHVADRAAVSLVYSLALVFLTIAVLCGYRLYQRYSPATLFLMAGGAAASGLALSAGSSSLPVLYLTYGVIFGSANGLGYGYALQLSAQAARRRRGLAMGLVTAFYAVGATVAPLLFSYLIKLNGNALALLVMSIIVLMTALLAAILVKWSAAVFNSEAGADKAVLSASLKRSRALLWLGYGSAVAAGLMVIGHAYGIAVWLGLDPVTATWAPTWAATIVALGNMIGGFTAGYVSDRVSSRTLLLWLPLLTGIGLLLILSLSESTEPVAIAGLGGLAIIGFSYGAIIAVYPVAVADVFGVLAASRIYGQVFTAWGLAGLTGPWLSGWLFDQSAAYTMALWMALLLSVISVFCVRACLPAPLTPE